VAATRGFTVAELLAVLAVLAIAAAVVLPGAAALTDVPRTQAGARVMAGLFSAERWKGVAGRRNVGFQFRKTGETWTWREVRDGNGNGLRTAEIASGVDAILASDRALESLVPGVRLGIPPGGPYPEAPPGTDLLTEADAPVRFGTSSIVSFGPFGSTTSGTLYVTDGRSGLYAVVLFGPSARLRVWRWDRGASRWTL
jgi:prepilin-type N-terminal cleavage/methylation domain-containing protein